MLRFFSNPNITFRMSMMTAAKVNVFFFGIVASLITIKTSHTYLQQTISPFSKCPGNNKIIYLRKIDNFSSADNNFDIHGSVHRRWLSRNTNKMQLCIRIYYFKVYWRLNMFQAAHRSSSGALNCICNLCNWVGKNFPTQLWQQPVTIWVYKLKAANTCWAFNKLWNNKFYYKAASCWYFYRGQIITIKKYNNMKITYIKQKCFGLILSSLRSFVSNTRSEKVCIHIYLLTYLLTPWSRVLLEKLREKNFAASQEIPRIYGTRKFLTVPTSALHLLRLRDTSSRNTPPPEIRMGE
jgi:hypothetical protein